MKVNLKKQEIASKERMKQVEISRDLANQRNVEKRTRNKIYQGKRK